MRGGKCPRTASPIRHAGRRRGSVRSSLSKNVRANMSVHDYLIDHEGFDWPGLLSGWSWLLPPEFAVWLVNRFGDLFLVPPDGTVLMLDVGAGTLTKLAGS